MSEVDPRSGPPSEYIPFRMEQSYIEPNVDVAPRPKTAGTRSSYVVAFLPALALFVDILIFAAGQISWTDITVVGLIFDLIAYGWARRDQRTLNSLGLRHPTSAWLAIIAPTVYLFVRGTRAWPEVGSGYRPAWVSVLVAVFILFMVFGGLPIAVALINARNAYGG